MFNFKEELAKYRKSLETTELSGGVSGDEVRDILDIAKELVNARAAGFEPEAVAPVRPVAAEAAKEETSEAAKSESQQAEDAEGNAPAGEMLSEEVTPVEEGLPVEEKISEEETL